MPSGLRPGASPAMPDECRATLETRTLAAERAARTGSRSRRSASTAPSSPVASACVLGHAELQRAEAGRAEHREVDCGGGVDGGVSFGSSGPRSRAAPWPASPPAAGRGAVWSPCAGGARWSAAAWWSRPPVAVTPAPPVPASAMPVPTSTTTTATAPRASPPRYRRRRIRRGPGHDHLLGVRPDGDVQPVVGEQPPQLVVDVHDPSPRHRDAQPAPQGRHRLARLTLHRAAADPQDSRDLRSDRSS